MRIDEILASAARESPEAPALWFDSDVLSFRELDARADRLARALVGLAAGRGDRVEDRARHEAAEAAHHAISDRVDLRASVPPPLHQSAKRRPTRIGGDGIRVEDLEQQVAPAIEHRVAIVQLNLQHVPLVDGSLGQQPFADTQRAGR